MARSVETINEEMDAEQAAQPVLVGINSTSQTIVYGLWKYITSVIINSFEQIQDIFKSEIESEILLAAVGSAAWLQAQAFKFQYDSVTPQIIELIDFAPSYPIIDATKRLIIRCSVKTSANKTVSIKVAKDDGSGNPIALTTPELNSFKGYMNDISFAGIQENIYSYTADKFYFKAIIYYNGQYASVIQATVIAAINDYFSKIPFDGNIKLVSLIDYIQAVAGVSDILINDAALRADTTLFANKTYLIQASTEIYPTYPTFGGYVVGETTAGQTLLDQLTFVAQ